MSTIFFTVNGLKTTDVIQVSWPNMNLQSLYQLVCLRLCDSESQPFLAGCHTISAVPPLLDVMCHNEADCFHSSRETVQSVCVIFHYTLSRQTEMDVEPTHQPACFSLRLQIFPLACLVWGQKRVYTQAHLPVIAVFLLPFKKLQKRVELSPGISTGNRT